MFLCFSTASGIEGIDVLVADVGDQDSLERMCSAATVVIDCVGPVGLQINDCHNYIEPLFQLCEVQL